MGTLLLTLRLINRTPYSQSDFYQETLAALDSIEGVIEWQLDVDSLEVGYSKISITPATVVPLAGYGARDPKEYERIQDSAFVRTLVFQSGERKQALISADLLLIHPEQRKRVEERLKPNWKAEELFFTATHTHSGHGGWAPGAVGKLFAGEFDEKHLDFLTDRISVAVLQVETSGGASIQYGEMAVNDHVKNRLVGNEGTEDPWLKVVSIKTSEWEGLFSTFSAHATCFGADSRRFSGDYPAELCEQLEREVDFAAFAAGAVASMGPEIMAYEDSIQILELATSLSEQVKFLSHIGMGQLPTSPLRSFRVPIYLRDPSFKISKNLALRPWLFERLVGSSPVYISVFQVGKILIIGFPCDFSGELALLLYEEARNLGYQLIITSFNGGYIGYVPKDEWYDLDKYETRTMSWYGPDTGAYFSEITLRILTLIQTHDGNH